MHQNDVQFVKMKTELFFICFNRVISEYSCLHVDIVFHILDCKQGCCTCALGTPHDLRVSKRACSVDVISFPGRVNKHFRK